MKKQRKFPATTGVREQKKVDIAAMRDLAHAHGDKDMEAELNRIGFDKLHAVVSKQRRPFLDIAQSANEERKADASEDHECWKVAAAKIRAEQPDLKNKSEIARRVRKLLKLTASVRTIRRVI